MEVSSQDLGVKVEAYRAGRKIVVQFDDPSYDAEGTIGNLRELLSEAREQIQQMIDDRQNLLTSCDNMSRSNSQLRLDIGRLSSRITDLERALADKVISGYASDVVMGDPGERLVPKACECHGA